MQERPNRKFTHLENAGAVRSAPRVEEVVLARADEPLAAVRELERQHAAVVQVQLVLVGFGVVQHLDVAALHAHRQPLARRTVAEREDLRLEVVLLQLSALRNKRRDQCGCVRVLRHWCRLTSRKSHDRTVLSRPPVHNLLPSGEISMQLAPSV